MEQLKPGDGREAAGRLVDASRTWLNRPVDASSLAAFRILFGLLMLWDVLRYIPSLEYLYITPSFHFTYPGFDFVRPWPGNGLYVHFGVLALAALGIALGCFYRISALVFLIGFGYVFLLDKAKYLNHFYLIVLLAFLFVLVDAHRAASLDGLRKPQLRTGVIPFWHLAVFRAQLVIVYFYAGVTKLSADWLQGEPMRTWLAGRTGYPIVGPWFTQEWVVYLFSYGGLLFDLSIGFLLLWRRTRLVAFCFLLSFHLMNHWIFIIGVFPFLGVAAFLLFVEPDTPRWLARRVRASLGGSAARPRAPAKRLAVAADAWQRAALILVSIHLLVQVLVPLRHWLYPGNVAWTEEGHRFSWRMMARAKEGKIRFLAIDRESRRRWIVNMDEFLTKRQQWKMGHRPDMIVQFAQHVRDELVERGISDPIILADSWASLNGRAFQRLVDPRVNLAEVETGPFSRAEWILPLTVGLEQRSARRE